MTLTDYLSRNKGVSWSHTGPPQVVHRTYAELLVNSSASSFRTGGEGAAEKENADQTAYKPGSVPPLAGRGGHSSGPLLAERFSRPTRTPRSGNAPTRQYPCGLGRARDPYSVLLLAGVTRRHVVVEPGLSSTHQLALRGRDRPAV